VKPTPKNVLLMLCESNAIEGVYDRTALVQAHRAWKYLMTVQTMTTRAVRHAHAILMKHQPLASKYVGDWRDIPVYIGGVKKIQPKVVIQEEMARWCFKTNTVDRNFDPITLHIEFENIHPFVDGNGRMGRLLLNWHLVKRNKSKLLVYTEANKHTYYMLFDSYRRRFLNNSTWEKVLWNL
jgi:Fic family protein